MVQKFNEKKEKFKDFYLVLQDEHLYIFEDPKDTKAVNVLNVTETNLDPVVQVQKKKLGFEISDKQKKYVFVTLKQEELREWGEKILFVKNKASDKVQYHHIFGQTLAAAVTKNDGSEIPSIISKTIAYLDKPGNFFNLFFFIFIIFYFIFIIFYFIFIFYNFFF